MNHIYVNNSFIYSSLSKEFADTKIMILCNIRL
jgi:hypothetical protein